MVDDPAVPPTAPRSPAAAARVRLADRTLGDALIGGVAWSLGATVVTREPGDFIAQGIPVLTY